MHKKKKITGFGSLCQQQAATGKKISSHTVPIYASSGFSFKNAEEAIEIFQDREKGYAYARHANPTVEMCEETIATLEVYGSEMKAKAQMFSSGMAAITAAILSCVKPGEKILTQNLLYGTTDELMKTLLADFQIQTIQTNLHDADTVETLLKKDKKIKLIYLETPSNPVLEILDIAEMVSLAKAYGCKTIVDNTFASPYLQQPLLLGADLSVHSTTKYLNGHGSGLGGIVVGTDKKLVKEEVWKKVKLTGACANAWDAWLVLQGIKTLELRMQRHCENAKKVAFFLDDHPSVLKVNYPGLKKHPQHNLAKKQMRDFGGMLSFDLKGGIKAGIRFINNLSLGQLITTLGTTDTIYLHPASMSHVNVPKAQRLQFGITDGLVRMSVGIETAEDIINDMEQALER